MILPHEEDFIRAGGQFEDVHDRSLVYVEMILEQGRRLTHLYKLEYKAYHSHRASQCSERLGWKIAHVTKGVAKHSTLKSYTEESGLVCGQLIRYDKQFSRYFTRSEGLGFKIVRDGLAKGLPFTSCTAIEFAKGVLVAKDICGQGYLLDRKKHGAALLFIVN
ncbi:hypothetical protein MPH_09203 [Macrophomina phaseolina MS6]|uniref:Uncharacterized protein n=1 Tax=Macrophomina phaseolina (strain MS6) TaxID=1126212 RepID=K2RLN1_MACPH|nr:hypothetical protein MPH_09203 [Macrophomina phaseolina MS6]